MIKVLDACCGERAFWFDKKNPFVTFMDQRKETGTLCDGRALSVSPDVVADFRAMPFPGFSFDLVVFDPPHLIRAGDKSWLKKKYGLLGANWKEDISQGFKECFRVLKPTGILVFKWNETQVSVTEVLKLTDRVPLFGHKTARTTHWMLFTN